MKSKTNIERLMNMRNGHGYIDPTLTSAINNYSNEKPKKEKKKKIKEPKKLVYNCTPAWTAPERKRDNVIR